MSEAYAGRQISIIMGHARSHASLTHQRDGANTQSCCPLPLFTVHHTIMLLTPPVHNHAAHSPCVQFNGKHSALTSLVNVTFVGYDGSDSTNGFYALEACGKCKTHQVGHLQSCTVFYGVCCLQLNTRLSMQLDTALVCVFCHTAVCIKLSMSSPKHTFSPGFPLVIQHTPIRVCVCVCLPAGWCLHVHLRHQVPAEGRPGRREEAGCLVIMVLATSGEFGVVKLPH